MQEDNEDEDEVEVKMRAVDIEQSLNVADLLKKVGHGDVLKLYMFLLERHSTLDSAALRECIRDALTYHRKY